MPDNKRYPDDFYSDDRSQYGKNYAVFYGDTRGDVELKIGVYFVAWPKNGFSTRIVVMPTYNKDRGYWYARVERWNSCE